MEADYWQLVYATPKTCRDNFSPLITSCPAQPRPGVDMYSSIKKRHAAAGTCKITTPQSTMACLVRPLFVCALMNTTMSLSLTHRWTAATTGISCIRPCRVASMVQSCVNPATILATILRQAMMFPASGADKRVLLCILVQIGRSRCRYFPTRTEGPASVL